MLDERVLRATDGRLQLVELALELVCAVAGQLQRVLGRIAVVEEVGAELAEAGDLPFVEGLLRGHDLVRVLLRVAQGGRDLAALEDVAIDRQGDLRDADQRRDDHLDRGEVPPVRLGLECVDDGLHRHLLAEAYLPEDEGHDLLGGRVDLQQRVAAEQAALGVGRSRHLLLAVGDAAQQLELGVGAADEFLEALGHAPQCILRRGRDVGGVDDEPGLGHCTLDALNEFLLALAIERSLGAEDLLLDRGQRGGLLALGVLVGLEQQPEVRQHPLVGFENDTQLVLARAVHPCLLGAERVLRGDEVDREFLLLTVDLVVQLEAEREVLAVLRIADLAGLDDVARQDLEELRAHLGGVDVDVLDLLLDDLLFVGEVLVDVAVALDVGLHLQQRQRLLHVLRERWEVEAEAVVHEHREVAGRGLEALDVLDEKQRLEEPDRELVVEVSLGDVD